MRAASLITMGILFGFVFVILMLISVFGGLNLNLPIMIVLTILFNALGWLFSPFFMDMMYRWFYATKPITIEELAQKSPASANLIQTICQKYNFKVPKMRLIADDNPTAFTFGSGRWNSRLAISEGLFTYLEEDERAAVIGHEMGHIKHLDFVIMTIAATAVEILYELYFMLSRRSSGNNKKGNLAYVGLIAYVFYWIGTYLLLYLSRSREYDADHFSSEETHNPDALSRALIKIAYGIIAKPEDARGARLLNATRALGIFDPKNAKHVGNAFGSSKHDWNFVAQVLAYDLVSPWAKVLELGSTHPLTGKRIDRLSEMAQKLGQKSSIDMAGVRSIQVDHAALKRGFVTGVIIYYLPALLPFVALGYAAAFNPSAVVFVLGAAGLGMLLKLLYKYHTPGEPQTATTLQAMSDLYASPVRGRYLALSGNVIGKGQAGSKFHEDMMLQDQTGLIYLNYESAVPLFGNLMFGWKKVRQLINQHVNVRGWFFRSISHHFDMELMTTDQGAQIKSHPLLWGIVGSAILMFLSIVLWSSGIYEGFSALQDVQFQGYSQDSYIE